VGDLEDLASAAQQNWQGQASAPFAYPPCPVCGYRGKPVRKPKGSWAAIVLLFLFAVLLGFGNPLWGGVMFVLMLLYALVNRGQVWKCAHCGAKRADAAAPG
jgi:hypothetical protein